MSTLVYRKMSAEERNTCALLAAKAFYDYGALVELSLKVL